VFTICVICYVILPVKYVLYDYPNTLRNICAEPNVAVVCNSLISFFSVMLLRYYLSDFEMVSLPPIITGITFAFTFHMYYYYYYYY